VVCIGGRGGVGPWPGPGAPVDAPRRARRTRRPPAWRVPGAWSAAGRGGRDPGGVRAVGRDRPVASQAGAPRVLPAPVLGLPIHRAAGAGVARQALPPAASAGAIASSAVPGMGRVPTELHLDLRHDALHHRRGGRDPSSRTWYPASGWRTSSRARRPRPRCSWCSPTRWNSRA
jgi:hypothetical protein